MQKFIYQMILSLVFFIVAGQSYVQAQIPAELKTRLQGKTTLKTIMQEVDQYYKDNSEEPREENNNRSEETDDNAYAKWKRWEWYMSSRLGPDGGFVNISQRTWEAHMNRKNAEALSGGNTNRVEGLVTAGAWGFVGPGTYGTVWGQLPGNGRVDRVAFDPTNAAILYAGSPSGGFWKSIDYGATWINFSDYPSALGVSGIAVDHANAGVIYILTGDGDSNGGGGFVFNAGYDRQSIGVLKSIDGGKTWQPTGGFPVAGSYYGYNLAICPSNSNILIAATSAGLFRTNDGGLTWNLVNGIYPGGISAYTDVKFNPLNGNSVYASAGGVFFVSNDEGTNWHQAGFNISIAGANRIQIGIAQYDTTNMYLLCGPFQALPAVGYYGLYRSTDGGQNFTRINTTPNILGNGDAGEADAVDQTIYDLCIAVNPSFSNSVFIAGKTIWASANAGVSFTHKTYYWGGPGSNAVHPDIHCLEFNPLNGNLYTGTDGGLYTSNSSGVTWSFISDGLNSTQWYHLTAVTGLRSYLLGGLQDNGIRNRISTSPAFNHIVSGDGFCGAYDPNDNAKFFAVVNTSGKMYSADGANFINSTDFGSYFPFVGRHPTNSNIIFVGREDSIFKSSDGAASFSKINIGGKRRIVFCPSNPSRIFSANSAKIWRSNDGGINWTDLTASSGYPAGSPVITCVAVNPTNANLVFVTFGGFGTKKVLYSTDAGATWQDDVSSSLPNLPVNCVVVNTDNSVYIGTDDGVYYQAGTGINWSSFYANLPLVPVTDLIIFNGADQMIYASTFGRGIWYSPLYNACGTTLSLSGSVSGIQNYASGDIGSTQSITGGSGSVITYQSAVLITLSPGFIAPNGTRFYANSGPCVTPGRTTTNRSYKKKIIHHSSAAKRK